MIGLCKFMSVVECLNHIPKILCFRFKKNKTSDELSSAADYEIPKVAALPDPSLLMEHNIAYGKITSQQMELTDNVSYGVTVHRLTWYSWFLLKSVITYILKSHIYLTLYQHNYVCTQLQNFICNIKLLCLCIHNAYEIF